MLYYAIVFLIIALIAGFFGFFGVAGLAATIAKILFVIQESFPDVAQEALNIGVAGYLVKTDANQLLVAVDTVLDGRQFVSAALLKKL